MTGRRRLLVLDDEADFATFVARVASDLGYDAASTNSAAAFKTAYLASPPDVIVLDIVMPETDGIEVVGWLLENGCRARIIVVTGYNPTFARAAQTIGAEKGHLDITQLQKPVKLADLRFHLARDLDDSE
jgi:CheY-like chemotaxis protein